LSDRAGWMIGIGASMVLAGLWLMLAGSDAFLFLAGRQMRGMEAVVLALEGFGLVTAVRGLRRGIYVALQLDRGEDRIAAGLAPLDELERFVDEAARKHGLPRASGRIEGHRPFRSC
jgi:hypothetical protein